MKRIRRKSLNVGLGLACSFLLLGPVPVGAVIHTATHTFSIDDVQGEREPVRVTELPD